MEAFVYRSPLPAGALVLDRIELVDERLFARWLERWKARHRAGELLSVLVSLDNTHALVVARPGPTLPLGARQLELDL